jgi:hypothetical protein
MESNNGVKSREPPPGHKWLEWNWDSASQTSDNRLQLKVKTMAFQTLDAFSEQTLPSSGKHYIEVKIPESSFGQENTIVGFSVASFCPALKML